MELQSALHAEGQHQITSRGPFLTKLVQIYRNVNTGQQRERGRERGAELEGERSRVGDRKKAAMKSRMEWS